MAETRKTPPPPRPTSVTRGDDNAEPRLRSVGGDTARLRDGIDRGGGDKVAFSDPAAAPLGTDDEAAGFGPTPAQVAEAGRHEIRAPARAEKPAPADQPSALSRFRLPLLIGVLLIALMLVGWISL